MRGGRRRDGPGPSPTQIPLADSRRLGRVGTGLPRPRPRPRPSPPVSAGVSCPGRFCFQSTACRNVVLKKNVNTYMQNISFRYTRFVRHNASSSYVFSNAYLLMKVFALLVVDLISILNTVAKARVNNRFNR